MFLYDNLPIYILIFIILFFLTIFIYIKLAYPFWNIQPVYHPYDFWRCFYGRSFRIYPNFHPNVHTKYCNPEDVDIIPFVDATDIQKKDFVNMIQCYFVKDENAMCMFHLENLDAYFSGHQYSSYISFYKQKFYKRIENEKGEIDVIHGEKPRGCISSRSGVLYINGHKENIYWLDFTLVDRGATATEVQRIQRELFETHIYKIGFIGWREEIAEQIRVWIFRKMGQLFSGIIPFIRFSVKEYEIPNNQEFFKTTYPEHVVLVDIHKGNMRKMLDALEIAQRRFSTFCMTDITNLQGLITAGNFHVFVLEKMGDILAMYFFKDTRVRMEESGSLIELAGSVWLGGSVGLFNRGFLGAIGEVVKKNPIYRRLLVDNLSDNGIINFGEWFLNMEEGGAYYTYNMVVPYSNKNIFIMF